MIQRERRNWLHKIGLSLLSGALVLTTFAPSSFALKPDNETIGEVENIAPVVDFQMNQKRKVDLVFNVDETAQNDLNTLESKVNSIVKPELEASNIDYQINISNRPNYDRKVIADGYGGTYAIHSDGTVWKTTTPNNSPPTEPVQVQGLTDIVDIWASRNHFLAVKTDGTVFAIGNNTKGQLGDGTTTNSSTPIQVQGLTNIIQVAGGESHSIALRSDGVVFTWGSNNWGQIGNGVGNGDGVGGIQTTPVSVFYNVKKITGTWYGTVVLDKNGNIYQWGKVFTYQSIGYTSPTQLTSLTGVVNISNNFGETNHFFAIKSDKTLWAYGDNDSYQLGTGNKNYPGPFQVMTNVIASTASSQFSYAVKEDGSVYNWGKNTYGELGDKLGTAITTPIKLRYSITGAKNVFSGKYHSVVLKEDGSIWGVGDFTLDKDPVQLLSNVKPIPEWGLRKFGKILTNTDYSFPYDVALSPNGKVWTWGNNTSGQLGNGMTTNSSVPVQAQGLNNIVDISVGFRHSLALTKDGRVYAWGLGSSGQLGQGNTNSSSIPIEVSGISNVKAIFALSTSSFAVTNDGKLYAWGGNGGYQLGVGNNTNQSLPVLVNGINGIIDMAMAGGSYTTFALQSNGEVYSWGTCNSGTLGLGALSSSKSTPQKINELSNVVDVQAINEVGYAIDREGNLYSWGDDLQGLVGNPESNKDETRPYTVNISNIVSLVLSSNTAIALTSTGDVYGWGSNLHGQIGSGGASSQTIQTPIKSLIQKVKKILTFSNGQGISYFLKEDGTVWSTGIDYYGALGDGGTVDTTGTVYSSTPVQVSNLNNVIDIFGGNLSGGAITVSGITYSWGYNQHGRLGDGTTASKSAPIQVKDLNLLTIVPPTLDEILNSTSWRSNAERYFIDLRDIERDELNDSTKLESVLTKLMKDQIKFIGFGTSTNQSQIEGLIQKNTGKGAFFDNTNLDTALTKLTNFISNRKIVDVNLSIGDTQYNDTVTMNSKINSIVKPKLLSEGIEANIEVNNTDSFSSISTKIYGKLSAGGGSFGSHSIFLQPNGIVKTVGDNAYGQIGNLTNSDNYTPVQPKKIISPGVFEDINKAKDISGGMYYSVILEQDGTVWTAGKNDKYQLGHNSGTTQTFFRKPLYDNNLTDIIKIDAGGYHTVALKNDGTVWVFGDESFYQDGNRTNSCCRNGSSQIVTIDYDLTPLTNIVDISAGYDHSLAVDANGDVWAWTVTDVGELGTGVFNVSYQYAVKVMTNAKAVSAGHDFSLVLKNDGTVWSFGRNDVGQLGDSTTVNKSSPVQILGLSNIIAISAGENHSLALKNDGTVYSWGNNSFGELGIGSLTNQKTPMLISTLSNIIQISAGFEYSLAMDSNGMVFAWGNNSNGEYGNGTTTTSYTPINTGITLMEVIPPPLNDVLNTISWRPNTNHFFIDISDVERTELNDSIKLDSILTQLMKDQIEFISLGTVSNQTQMESLIRKNLGKGAFYDNTTLDTALDLSADYIISTAKASSPTIIDTIPLRENKDTQRWESKEMEYITTYVDREQDPKYAERWKFTHDPSAFENPMGSINQNGEFISNPIKQFLKTGRYEIIFQARDNPKNDDRFDNYRLWSKDSITKRIVYAHRVPIAQFKAVAIPNGTDYSITVTDSSYDLDHTSLVSKGILDWKWRWKETTADGWNNGQLPSTLPSNKSYVVSLQVKDMEGEWSDETTQDVSTKNINLPPVAQFMAIPNPLGMNETLNILDTSYDPNGDAIAERKWTVKKSDGTNLYVGPAAPTNLASYGLGNYSITLEVKDQPSVGLPLWSQPYTQMVEVVNHPPVPAFTMPEEVYRDTLISIVNQTSNPDGDGHPVSYQWTAELDGTSYNLGTLANPSLTIKQLGIGKNAISDHWNIQLTATDSLGASATLSKPLKVKNQVPVASIVGSNAAKQFSTQTYLSGGMDADSEDGTTLEYYWKVSQPDGSVQNLTTKDINLTFNQLGAYTLEHWVIDQLGEKSNMASLEVGVTDNIVPTMTITSPNGTAANPSIIPGDPFMNWTYSDPEGNPQYAYQFDFMDYLSRNTVYSITNSDTSGNVREYQINSSNTFQWNKIYKVIGYVQEWISSTIQRWSNPSNEVYFKLNNPPTAGFTVSPTSAVRGQTFTIISTATDPNSIQGDSLSYQYYVTPPSGSEYLQTTNKDWTVSWNVVGSYIIRQVVTDSLGSSVQTSKTVTVVNQLPSVNVTDPSSTSAASPILKNTKRPTIQWAFSDPDGDSQQRYKVYVYRASDNVLVAQSGEVSSAANQWIVNADLVDSTVYYVQAQVYDGYGWSAISTPKYMKIILNGPPTAGFIWSPSMIWEGDIVQITSTATDPDGDILSYTYEVTNPGGTKTTYSTANPSFKVSVPGTWIIKQTVVDPGGASDTIFSNFIVGELTVSGQVQHTLEWESKRQEWNTYNDPDRPITMFWAGEKFLLYAATTNTETTTKCTAVTVKLIQKNKTVNLTVVNSPTNTSWSGNMWEESFFNLPDGTYQMEFTASYSNGTVKKNTVSIQIKNSALNIVKTHRIH